MSGISCKHRIFASGQGRKRAATVATNKSNAILINQLSEEDTVVVEINKGNTKFVAASIYLAIGEEIVEDLYKLENTWFVQKISGLTTVHEVDKAYGVLNLS